MKFGDRKRSSRSARPSRSGSRLRLVAVLLTLATLGTLLGSGASAGAGPLGPNVGVSAGWNIMWMECLSGRRS